MKAVKRLALWLVVLTAVLAGCRLEGRVGLDVAEDGSGSAVVEIGLDDELLELASQFPGFDIDQAVGALGFENGEVAERREGNMTIYSTSRDFSSVADLEAIIESLGQIEVGTVDLSVDEEGASFSGRLDPPDITPTLGGIGLVDPSQLSENVVFTLEVKLPGEVTSHDADEVLADGSLRWNLALDAPTEMNATSSFDNGGIPTWLIAIIAALVVAIGGFVAVGRGRGDIAAATVASAQAPEPPKGFGDG